jgi:hypothetical protein
MVAKQHTAEWSVGHQRNKEGEIKKFLESDENENTTYQNLWDSESEIRGKFISMSTYS